MTFFSFISILFSEPFLKFLLFTIYSIEKEILIPMAHRLCENLTKGLCHDLGYCLTYAVFSWAYHDNGWIREDCFDENSDDYDNRSCEQGRSFPFILSSCVLLFVTFSIGVIIIATYSKLARYRL